MSYQLFRKEGESGALSPLVRTQWQGLGRKTVAIGSDSAQWLTNVTFYATGYCPLKQYNEASQENLESLFVWDTEDEAMARLDAFFEEKIESKEISTNELYWDLTKDLAYDDSETNRYWKKFKKSLQWVPLEV